MIDSFFVKTRRRIEALMMVMTLCLLVYNFSQYRVRKTLQEQNNTIPNQLGKSINNPTVKWLFQCMEGIAVIKTVSQAFITNLDELRCKIISLFGKSACQIYGISSEIAGMQDINKVYEVTKIAQIHDEIQEMKMGYETLIGDMGSSLSGGQRQRVLLARALYKSPKLLFLDEATSHLDEKTEIKINDALKKLNITQIVIAHRQETIRMADRVIKL